MNEDRYVYVRIQASTFETILSLTPTSKNRIERSIWNSGARVLFISILFRVRAFTWFHQFILSFLSFIVSHRVFFFFLFFSLSFMRFFILSLSVVAPFFVLRYFFSHEHFSCCLLSPFGSFHPRFPRRLIFFVIVSLFSLLSFFLFLSLLPAVPIIASYAVCFSMRHRPCYRFVSFCQRASFLFDFLALSHAHWWR